MKEYNQATVFINFSQEETMGMTTVEAIACGTPVIVYNSTALPEVVDTNSGVIVYNIHDMQEIVQAISKIENTDYSDCHNSARKYEKSIQSKEYIELYRSIIHEK